MVAFSLCDSPHLSGKTTIGRALVSYLSSAPHNLRVGVLSTDDLYHTHDALVSVARTNPTNKLLSGRGQPGTHDVALGRAILAAVAKINEPGAEPVQLPVFDKSLHAGEGDRAAQTIPLPPPVDVFILEGWSMGFLPLSEDQVARKLNEAPQDSPLRQHSLQDLLQINENLKGYADSWYNGFDAFLQIRPTDLQHVYTWRLQQEHAMKAANGGQGMTDEQVKACVDSPSHFPPGPFRLTNSASLHSFVDRYMPGYLLFLDTIPLAPSWKGNGKSVLIDLSRTVIAQEDW